MQHANIYRAKSVINRSLFLIVAVAVGLLSAVRSHIREIGGKQMKWVIQVRSGDFVGSVWLYRVLLGSPAI